MNKAGTLDPIKLQTMLGMQAEMNATINPEWLTAGYPYLRAAMIEGAEAIEHAGWKWWKKQTCDIGQLRMELVDIWHFALSDALVTMEGSMDEESGATWWVMFDLEDPGRNHISFDDNDFLLDTMGMLDRLELLIGLAAAERFDTRLFEALLEDVEMTWDDLYRAYVGKNVLNIFRQDHGYKDGTYQKIWAGLEDNEYLTRILTTLDSDALDYREQVYQALTTSYRYYAPACQA